MVGVKTYLAVSYDQKGQPFYLHHLQQFCLFLLALFPPSYFSVTSGRVESLECFFIMRHINLIVFACVNLVTYFIPFPHSLLQLCWLQCAWACLWVSSSLWQPLHLQYFNAVDSQWRGTLFHSMTQSFTASMGLCSLGSRCSVEWYSSSDLSLWVALQWALSPWGCLSKHYM